MNEPYAYLYFQIDLDNHRYVSESTGIDVVPYCFWHWAFGNQGVYRVDVLNRDRENVGAMLYQYIVARFASVELQ
jgi:hypothetical protein